MNRELAAWIFIAVFTAAVALATWLMLRAFLRGVRLGRALPHVPIPPIFPPVPVEPTGGVTVVGTLAVAWAAVHLITISYWALTGYLMPRTAPAWFAAAYVAGGAVLAGAGGGMLLARRPLGRTLMSWGLFLLGLLAFFALTMALLLPKYDEMPVWARRLSWAVVALMGAHIVFDSAVGALGQKVGRPAGYREPPAVKPRAAEPSWPRVPIVEDGAAGASGPLGPDEESLL